MKVKELIKELLNYPMDAEAITSMQINYEWKYGNISTTVDYEDGTIGIVGKEETNESM